MASDSNLSDSLTVSQLIERLVALKRPDARLMVTTREGDWHVVNTVDDVRKCGADIEILITST